MDELRKEKKELRKARQILHRSGCKGSAADKANSNRWFQVMREHAKLRKLLADRDSQKANARQSKKFKQNPMKFGKELFHKKVNGA